MKQRHVYLDNAATTPVRPEVLEAMMPFLTEEAFGNPSSAHAVGRRARAAVAKARRQIAEALGVEPHDVFFTSGGTEAANLAIIGAAVAAQRQGTPARVAVSAIEHPAVLEAADAVTSSGGDATVLPVDERGQIDVGVLEHALSNALAVCSIMWVNNEVGIIQDIARLAERCSEAGVPFHTDAVQAVGKIPCNIADIPCTMLTIAGHKLGGPKGVGALIVRNRNAVAALQHGGGQQHGIRPGTENVPGIVGLGEAVELAVNDRPTTGPRLETLRRDFEARLVAEIPDATITAADAPRAPHVTNVTVPGIDSEATVMHLDLAGIACSTGSACHTGSAEPSRVLTALGVPDERAARSLRFSFYKNNTAEDVERVLAVLPGVVTKVRALAESLGR